MVVIPFGRPGAPANTVGFAPAAHVVVRALVDCIGAPDAIKDRGTAVGFVEASVNVSVWVVDAATLVAVEPDTEPEPVTDADAATEEAADDATTELAADATIELASARPWC